MSQHQPDRMVVQHQVYEKDRFRDDDERLQLRHAVPDVSRHQPVRFHERLEGSFQIDAERAQFLPETPVDRLRAVDECREIAHGIEFLLEREAAAVVYEYVHEDRNERQGNARAGEQRDEREARQRQRGQRGIEPRVLEPLRPGMEKIGAQAVVPAFAHGAKQLRKPQPLRLMRIQPADQTFKTIQVPTVFPELVQHVAEVFLPHGRGADVEPEKDFVHAQVVPRRAVEPPRVRVRLGKSFMIRLEMG